MRGFFFSLPRIKGFSYILFKTCGYGLLGGGGELIPNGQEALLE